DAVGGGQPMVGLSGPSTWLVKCIEHRTIVPDRSWASWPGPRMSTWQGVFGGCCSPWATGWLPSPASPSNPCVVVGPSSGTGVERGALTVSTAVSTAVSIVVVDGPGLPMIVGATVTTVVVVLPVPVVVGLVVLIEIVVLVDGLAVVVLVVLMSVPHLRGGGSGGKDQRPQVQCHVHQDGHPQTPGAQVQDREERPGEHTVGHPPPALVGLRDRKEQHR